MLLSLVCSHTHAQFTDNTLNSGIFIGNEVGIWGNGMSAFDFNSDGFDDLTIAENLSGIALYQSEGDGSFELTDFVALNAVIKQVMWVDFDNDDDADLFATTNGSGLFLYERMEDGSLFYRAELFSQYAQCDAQGASWEDYDKDGWKDLFVCSYLYGQAPQYPNLLFHNDQGVFTEVGEQMGVASWANQGFQGVWTDFDKDGWKDLYVINDHEVGNEFYRNNAGVGFENLSAVNGSAMALASMSNSVADFDRDGDFDVFVSNGGYQALLQNTNNMFENVAAEYGITAFTFGWSGVWLDCDNDGWQDLYLCNTNGYANGDNNFFWTNEMGSAFSEDVFDPHTMSSYVAVTGDFNNDRFADIAVYSGFPATVHVWMNTALSVHHAVKIDLHGEVSDHAGVGAEVLAFIGSDVSLHQVLAGENYLSQNSSSVIIGCGEATMIDSLVVKWPSGWRDVFYNVPADADYDITEGETFQVSIASSDDFLMCAGSICNVQVLVSDAMFEGSILWSAGNEGFYAQVGDTGNYVVTITNVVGLQRMLSFTVNLHETPYVQTSITAPLCHGQSTAACELISDELAFVNGSEFLSSLTLTNLNTGAHTFSLVDVHGCASTLDVTIPETPAMSIAQSSIAICANATEIAIPEIYNATPPLDIEWWNEEEEDEEEQFEMGEYELMVTDFHGCEASFAVFVDHYSAVQLIVNADTACAGETSAYTWHAIGATQVVWAVVENNALDELPAGTYTLLAEDEHGCLSAHDFTIHDFAPIEIELSLDAMSNELQAAVSGGVEPYTWEWGTGATTPNIEVTESGTYALSITDAAGCTSQADTTIVLAHIDEHAGWYVDITPFTHTLTIDSPFAGQVYVYDMQGRVVATLRVSVGLQSIDVSRWARGRYVVRGE